MKSIIDWVPMEKRRPSGLDVRDQFYAGMLALTNGGTIREVYWRSLHDAWNVSRESKTVCYYTHWAKIPVPKPDEPNAVNAPPEPRMRFQMRVRSWVVDTFGLEVAANVVDRRQRFVEEAVELAQACGAPRDEVLQLVEYVYARPRGVVAQEVGGTGVTLAALCSAIGVDMSYCFEEELSRCYDLKDTIRERNAAKPKIGSVK